jgi:phage-related protein
VEAAEIRSVRTGLVDCFDRDNVRSDICSLILGPRCYELRVRDETQNWRILLRVDFDGVVIADVFAKRTRTTPKRVIDLCRKRLLSYDEIARERDKR